MDPNACLRRIDDLLIGDIGELHEACADLHGWLDGGGFEPKWGAYKDGTDYFKNWQGARRLHDEANAG